MHLRALIVLLAVMNLGVALWWAARPAPEGPLRQEPPAGVPRLLLASEATPEALEAAALAAAGVLDPVEGDEDAPLDDGESDAVHQIQAADGPGGELAARSDPAPATTMECFRLGPWQQEDQLVRALATLQPQVQRIVRREVPAGATGWRVMLPPQADREQAQAVVARLQAAGFNDYFIVGQGEEANAIALGRFTAEERARRHQASLQAAGFNAQVYPLGGGDPHLWLDVAATALGMEAARAAVQAAQADAINCAPLQ